MPPNVGSAPPPAYAPPRVVPPTSYAPPRVVPPSAGRPAPVRKPRAPRMHSLDMWRGIACVLVVVFHTTLVQGELTGHGAKVLAPSSVGEFLLAITRYMWIGVPMFFVISGYCITATADSARLRELPVRDYFIRRMRRIYPPYWAAMVFQILALILIDQVFASPELLANDVRSMPRPDSLGFSQWLGNLTLTESWRFQAFGDEQRYLLGQAWTLCFEEQFYALTGLILFVAPKRFFRAAIVISVATLGLKHGLRHFGFDTTGFFLDGRWLMFAAGILVYYVRNYGQPRARQFAAVIFLAFLGYALREQNAEFIAAIVFASVLLFTHQWDSGIPQHERLLRPAAFYGMICYSLYLVHGPIVRAWSQHAYNNGIRSDWQVLLLVVPVALAAATLVAWGFYLLVERRFLNARRV